MSYLIRKRHTPEHTCQLPSPLSAGAGSYWQCEDTGVFKVRPGCGKVWKLVMRAYEQREWVEAQWPPPPPGAPGGTSLAQRRGQAIREGRR